MSRLAWIITIPVSIIVVLFAVMNRDPVALNLWPLPWDLGAIPLYLLTLGTLLFGFFLGAFAMWVSAGKSRRKARMFRQELDNKTFEINQLKRDLQTAQAAAPTPRPAGQTLLPPAA
jgi:uncharacterized integral membrane protein